MWDIWVGLAVMVVLSAALFTLALKLRVKRRVHFGLACGTVAAIILFVLFLLDSVRMAWILPFSNLVVVGNWLPPLACFLAGLAWRLIPGQWWRRSLTVVPLIVICLWKSWGRYFEAAPAVGDHWKDRICMQTAESTCSAASAATLLAHYGIETREAEMVRLCMTRQWGTSMWGVYRGLRLRTGGTPYRVKVVTASVDSLLKSSETALLIVGIRRGRVPDDSRYTEDWGWTPGTFHAVCFLRPGEDDLVIMADPSVGPDHWSRENLNVLWTGVALRLVPR